MSDLILDKSRGEHEVFNLSHSIRLGVIKFNKILGKWVFKPSPDSVYTKSTLDNVISLIESIEG